MSEYFTASGNPGTGASGSSSTMRSEFTAIEQGFDKLPTMSGNGSKVVRVNAGGNALETVAMTIGADVQAYSANLDTLAAVTPGATGLALLDDTTAAGARTTIAAASVEHANWVGTVGGTANAITLTPSQAITAYAAGQAFRFLSSAANTAAATVNVSALGAKTIKRTSGIDLLPGDIASGAVIEIVYDGTNFELTSSSKVEGDRLFNVTASVGSNALTATLNPCVIDFRSSTLTSGTVNTRTVSSAISVVAPSGAEMGLVANQTTRIIVFAIDNSGTVELAIANANWSNLEIDESGLISTTAIDTAADSAGVIYSTTARSNVPYRIVGYLDITLATPGTWDTAPTRIQGMGGMAGANLIGHQYNWNDVSASRSANVTYYNTTGRDLHINATLTSTTTAAPYLNIGGINIRGSTQASLGMSVYGVVAPGESYSYTVSAGTPTLVFAYERY